MMRAQCGRICEGSLDEVLRFFLGSEEADADSAGAGAFSHADHHLFHQAPCGKCRVVERSLGGKGPVS